MSSTKLITNEYQIDRLKVNHYLVFNFIFIVKFLINSLNLCFLTWGACKGELLIQEMAIRVIIHFVVTDVK
ncbi:conserved hypothetical protein [Vibrio crassostreae]|nr:conserved hypothetical protein [Vibrio crassostreae]